MKTIRNVMTAQPHMIKSEETLYEAALKMAEYDCGSLVVGTDHLPEGVITDRDLVIRGLAEGLDPKDTPVSKIMTHGVITCKIDESLEDAADIMCSNNVRRLVVIDDEENVMGVLSVADILRSTENEAVNDNILYHLFKHA